MAVFTVIDHTELGAAAASYNVTSISASYDHLMLEVSARTDHSSIWDDHWLTINGDSGSNYSSTQLYAVSATVYSNRNTGATKIENLIVGGTPLTADTFCTMELWVPNYANTTGFKQVLAQCAMADASATDATWKVAATGGLWDSTAAINQITLTPKSGGDYIQYSTFTLYGVTGA
jgi:hypothetical protein|tara:strand:- start:67 stop:594 length:528 start_codon:yes stop_codon:yes gene_type:complete